MTTIGIQRSAYGRSNVAVLYDLVLGKLKEKAPTIVIPYGIQDEITPFYTVSFPKSYGQFPAVCMTIDDDSQREAALGRMIGGAVHGDESGVHKTTMFTLDVWGRNMLEVEAIASAVERIMHIYKNDFYDAGIIDYVLTKSTLRPYDPNAPRMWFGSEQAPGETWLRALSYKMVYFDTWSRYEEVYEIKRIDTTTEPYGTTVVIQSLGALIMGLLDTMYYERYLNKSILLPRIKRGRY